MLNDLLQRAWQRMGQERGQGPEAPDPPAVSVLFVCMGNICRSPMAEGVFRRMLEDLGIAGRVLVDSAGTHSYHAGSRPDRRGIHAAARRGADLTRMRARPVTAEDLGRFDYLLVMDRDNLAHVQRLAPDPDLQTKVRLFMDFAPELPEREVPDPYYGGPGGFERVLDLIEEASQGLTIHLRERYRI